jgi:hypothetical protein
MNYADYYRQGGSSPRPQQQMAYTTRRGFGPNAQDVPTGMDTIAPQAPTYGNRYNAYPPPQQTPQFQPMAQAGYGQQPQYGMNPMQSVTGRGAWAPNSIGTPPNPMDVMGNIMPPIGGLGGGMGGGGINYGAPPMAPEAMNQQNYWQRMGAGRARFTPWEQQTPEMRAGYLQYGRPPRPQTPFMQAGLD